MLLHPLIEKAYRVLDGQELTESEALALAEQIHGTDILDLVSLANKVRNKFAGDIAACSIINAKSGHCSQNCRFCAQAQAHNTGIETYELLNPDEVLAEAEGIYNAGVRTYGIVTALRLQKRRQKNQARFLRIMDKLHGAVPGPEICVSIGNPVPTKPPVLAEHHMYRTTMNLQTNRALRRTDLPSSHH